MGLIAIALIFYIKITRKVTLNFVKSQAYFCNYLLVSDIISTFAASFSDQVIHGIELMMVLN